MKSYEQSARITRESGTNFYPAFLFLQPEQRGAMMAVYAFSRLVDDAVDQSLSREVARKEIDDWRVRLDSCYDERIPDGHPLLPELKRAIHDYQIPRLLFEDLLQGVEMDLDKKRYETFGELEKYCYHVAGVVGLICNRIFGLQREGAGHFAVLLGTAFQLTNILRDIGSDLDRDRIYLPLEDFARFSYRPEDLQNRVRNDPYLNLMRFEAARTWGYFAEADRLLNPEEKKQVVPALVMSRFYQTILERLERKQFPSLERQIKLSKWLKIYLTVSSWLRWRWA